MPFPPGWYVAIGAAAVVSVTNPSVASATGLSQEIDVGDRIEWAAPASERSVTFNGCEMVVLAKQGRLIDDDDRGIAVDGVYASRVSLDGTAQDPMGVPVDLASALGTSNGGEVVTVENAPAWFGTPADSHPSFARLGADLSILGRRALDLASDFQPTLTCDDRGCLLAGRNGVQSLSARLLEFTGRTRANGLLSVTNANWQSGPLVTPTNDGYVVVFTDQVKDGVEGLFVAQVPDHAQGPIAPRLVREIPGKPLQALALVSGSSKFLVVAQEWPDTVQSTPAKLMALFTDGTAPTDLSTDSHDYEVDAFATGDHFVVAFRQKALGGLPEGSTTVAQISASGVVDRRPATRAFGPAVSTPRGRFVLDGSLDLHRIQEDGTEADAPIPALRTHYPEWRPVLVPGAGNLLLTYQDRDAARYLWHAVRVGPDGTPIDSAAPPVFARPVDPSGFAQASADNLEAAFDGSAFVLGWIDDAGSLELVHENPDSGARDTPVSLGSVSTDFRLHSGPRGVLVTWREGRMCGEDCGETRMLGLPLDRAMQPLLAAPAVLVDWSSIAGDVGPADFDGERWVLPRVVNGDLHVATITETGLVTTADPWQEETSFLVSAATLKHPRIAWSGTEYLVAFERDETDPATSAVTSDVRALRLDANLAALDSAPFPVAPAGTLSMAPEVVFDGARFVLAWRETWVARSSSDLAATFVAEDGTVQNSDCFFASNAPWSGWRATLAAFPAGAMPTAAGTVLIGYDRLDPDPALVSSRVKLRLISAPDGPAAPECAPPASVTPHDAPFVPKGCTFAPNPGRSTSASGGCACGVATRRRAADATGGVGVFAAILLARGRRQRRSARRDSADRDA